VQRLELVLDLSLGLAADLPAQTLPVRAETQRDHPALAPGAGLVKGAVAAVAPVVENSVELRGFEPLTPSMRTEHTVPQSCCRRTFPHVRDFQLSTVTASERISQRSAAPILLPESDTSSLSSFPSCSACRGQLHRYYADTPGPM